MNKKKRICGILAISAVGLFLAIGIVCQAIIGFADWVPPPVEEPEFIIERIYYDITWPDTLNALKIPMLILFGLSAAAFAAFTVLGVLDKKGKLKGKDSIASNEK